MLVPPVQLPPIPTAITQPQTIAGHMPQAVAQATAPIGSQAVTPSPKDERSQKAKERRKNRENKGEEGADPRENRGGHVNISV